MKISASLKIGNTLCFASGRMMHWYKDFKRLEPIIQREKTPPNQLFAQEQGVPVTLDRNVQKYNIEKNKD